MIEGPDLPDLESLERFRGQSPTSLGEYAETLFDDLNWDGAELSRSHIDAVVFKNSTLAGSKLRGARVRDSRFIDCDLSNSDWTGVSINRIEVRSTRLTGINGAEGTYENVLFKGCLANYSVFQFSRFVDCCFEDCDLTESTFEGSELERISFRNCNLKEARLWGGKLNSIDFRGSNLEGIQIQVEDLKSLTIDSSQAHAIALIAGVKIRNENED